MSLGNQDYWLKELLIKINRLLRKRYEVDEYHNECPDRTMVRVLIHQCWALERDVS